MRSPERPPVGTPFDAMLPEAQPPTASHDGGFANRSGARMPRRTPTDPTTPPEPSTRPAHNGRTITEDGNTF